MKNEYLIWDSVEILEKLRTSQGGLKVKARVCRSGILTYLIEGKPHRDLRRPDEIRSKRFLDSLHTSALTLNHPMDTNEVNSDNWDRYAVGHALAYPDIFEDPVTSETFIDIFLYIAKEQAIQDFESGKTQLSIGAKGTRIFRPGMWRDKEFDAEQVGLLCNHIALVDAGRAGPECSIMAIIDKVDRMKIKIGGKEFDLEQSAAEAINAEIAKLTTMFNDSEDLGRLLKKKLDAAEAKIDILDSLKADQTSSEEQVSKKAREIAKEFVRVCATASNFMDSAEIQKHQESFDIVQLKKAVIQSRFSKVSLADRTNEQIDVMYDLAISDGLSGSSHTTSTTPESTSIGQMINDAKDNNVKPQTYQEAMRKGEDRWKNKASQKLEIRL